MDLLQYALIFLILILAIFLGLAGVQVLLILRDLKKFLDKINNGNIQHGNIQPSPAPALKIKQPAVNNGTLKRSHRQRQKRFYKRTL